MKVCVVTLHPADDRRVFMRGVQTLLGAGHEVRLIATDPTTDVANPSSTSPLLTVRTEGPLRRSPRQRLALIVRLWRAAAQVDADAYHTHDPDLLPALLWLKWRRRRPVVYDVHEFYGHQFSRWLPPRFRRVGQRTIEAVERRLAKCAGNVIVVDEQMVAPFRRVGCRVLLAPNAVLARSFPPGRVDSHDPELVVASTGTLSQARGSLVLADLCREIVRRDLPVRVLIWERAFSEAERQRFRDRLGEVDERVELLAAMPPGELARHLGRCHIGLSTLQDALQYADAVPSKLFEYMSARLAIIASDLPATRRVLADVDGAVIVRPDDATAYVDAIEGFVHDRGRLETARSAARSACVTRFDWDAQVGPAYVSFFESLAGHGS